MTQSVTVILNLGRQNLQRETWQSGGRFAFGDDLYEPELSGTWP
jgi:hypothetical protein